MKNLSPAQASRSLFLRLLLGFAIVMLVIWLGVLAWIVGETRTIGARVETALIKTVARQILAGVRPLAQDPGQAKLAIARIEQLQNAFFQEIGAHGSPPFQVQLWNREALVYGSTGLPLTEPGPAERGRAMRLQVGGGDGWSSWTESEGGTTVRVVQQRVTGAGFSEANTGFYLLPVLVSFPFLLIPAWFVIRRGLQPLTTIVGEIEQRSPSDLAPLAPSSFKELAPLVTSVNRLMQRLTDRLNREHEFLLDAAHELKTPLAIIQINADSLTQSDDPARRQEAGRGLGQGVARATHTVHQLLAFARSGADHEEALVSVLDLSELLSTRIALQVQLAVERNIELELAAPPACLLPLHRESVTALVDNLLDNAIKYSPEGGRVAVELVAEADLAVLRVSDQGPGIAPEFRQKVFERFFRMPDLEQSGSGLGLSIVERAAARNSAAVRLEDNAGGTGLVVEVRFASGAALDR
ncbi:MAG: ATP-binding protein [Pseudomonadota bacterium]